MSDTPTTDNRPDYEVARDELRALVASLNLGATVSAASPGVDNEKDHEGKPRAWVHLLYVVTVKGRTFEYRMGEGHVPWADVHMPGRHRPIKVKVGTKLVPVRMSPEADNLAGLYMEKRNKGQAAPRFAPSYLHSWAEACAAVANAAKVVPDVAEVLGNVARDGQAMHQTFGDWCAEYGYDEDSRKAEAIYNACQEGARKLRAFLSPAQIEKLAELSARL